MTTFHWILIALVPITWVTAYLWYFVEHGGMLRWLRQRRERKAAEGRAHEEFLAAQARLRDELAAKYYPGGSGNGAGP